MNETLEALYKDFGFKFSVPCGMPIHISNVNRTLMAEALGELGFKKGAEVGVAEGMHAEILLNSIPDLELHCVDSYKHYDGYNEYEDLDKVYDLAAERLMNRNTILYDTFSMDAVKQFEDNSLDFVYIDAAHDFKNVSMDVCEWSKKVRVGGIVFGHDFKRSRRNVVDVKDVIPAYCYAKGIRPWFVLDNDIKDPVFGRDNPGWLFVRQETDKL